MFPINFNFPYRKKDGSVITMEKALDGAGADLDLIDLDDVAIQTPADNEGLVYNGSTQKWKNEPVVTGDLWAENAAHNLLNHNITSQSLNDLTVTVADDNSITVSGTASDAGYLVSSYLITGIKAGVNYKFGGFPSDLAEYSAYLEREDGGSSVSLGNFVGANTTYRLVIFFSGSFTTGGDPVTFKPIITLASDPSTEYAPYAMTNGELTVHTVKDSLCQFAYNDNVCIGTLFVNDLNISTAGDWAEFYTLPSNVPKPKYGVTCPAVTYPYATDATNSAVCEISTTGSCKVYLETSSKRPVSQVTVSFMYLI